MNYIQRNYWRAHLKVGDLVCIEARNNDGLQSREDVTIEAIRKGYTGFKAGGRWFSSNGKEHRSTRGYAMRRTLAPRPTPEELEAEALLLQERDERATMLGRIQDIRVMLGRATVAHTAAQLRSVLALLPQADIVRSLLNEEAS